MLEHEKAEAQQTLDELWAEHVIPFKLTAHMLEAVGEPGRYMVHFFDSRLQTLFIYWNPERESFKTAVREVVTHTVGQRSRAKAGWADAQLH
jgi:hypothetical protein